MHGRIGLQTTALVGIQTTAERAVADRQLYRNKAPDDAGTFCVGSFDRCDSRLSIVSDSRQQPPPYQARHSTTQHAAYYCIEDLVNRANDSMFGLCGLTASPKLPVRD
jgi:hypothetical protein